jgi:hypothetical protein
MVAVELAGPIGAFPTWFSCFALSGDGLGGADWAKPGVEPTRNQCVDEGSEHSLSSSVVGRRTGSCSGPKGKQATRIGSLSASTVNWNALFSCWQPPSAPCSSVGTGPAFKGARGRRVGRSSGAAVREARRLHRQDRRPTRRCRARRARRCGGKRFRSLRASLQAAFGVRKLRHSPLSG